MRQVLTKVASIAKSNRDAVRQVELHAQGSPQLGTPCNSNVFLWVLWRILVASAISRKVFGGRVVAFARAACSLCRWSTSILSGTIVSQHIFRIDALLVSKAIFPSSFGIRKWRPIVGIAGIQICTVLMEKLDHFHSPINAPEENQISGFVHVIWIRTSSKQGLGAFHPPSVTGGHERGVTFGTSVRSTEHEVDVCTFVDLLVDQFDVVDDDSVQ
mmetsp:Transcript_6741/g.41168  ORF Transcript_6741/g.41168 Transcript_6741/m.41168 type:complete len:215 (-) Transcript_6741:218-862(-)